MKYIKKCPFLILLIWSSAIAAAFHYGDFAGVGTLLETMTESQVNEAPAEGTTEADSPWNGNEGSLETPGDDGKTSDASKDAQSEQTGENAGNTAEAPDGIAEGESGAEAEAGDGPQEEAPKEVKYVLRQVDDTYFEDAVFIGDSRTVGLSQYGSMPQATFYAETGFTIYKFFTEPIVQLPDSDEKITVEQALSENQFKKVYLMIGINEMGRGTLDEFMAEYTKVVERIKELQPDAVVILEAIMKVGAKKSDSDPIFNNPNITARNEAISKLADNKRVFYFDMNPVVVDEKGNLNAQYSFDGIHLKAQYVQIWKDFLYANGVVEEE